MVNYLIVVEKMGKGLMYEYVSYGFSGGGRERRERERERERERYLSYGLFRTKKMAIYGRIA